MNTVGEDGVTLCDGCSSETVSLADFISEAE